MAYLVTACTLQSMVNDTTAAITTPYDLKTEAGAIAFGEYMRLRITVTSAPSNFVEGQAFVFNPCLFAASQYVASYPLAAGWVIQIDSIAGAGVFTSNLQLGSIGAETTQRNTKLAIQLTAANVMVIDYYFYASQDLYGYITNTVRNNRQTLQAAAAGQDVLDNIAVSAYTRALSYLEFILYEANATNLQPASIFYPDPYIRDSAATAQKQNSYAVVCKFIDNTVGGTIAWAGGALNANSLTDFSNSIGTIKFASFSRKGNPHLSSKIDFNFNDVQGDAKLIVGAENIINIRLNTPSQVPDKVVVRLWRVDDANFTNTQPFFIEYDIRTADLPAADATAYPNSISGEPTFSTPASFTAANPSNIEFRINGNYLVRDAQYRVWVGLYHNPSRFASSHVSRIMTAGSSRAVGLVITGNTQLLDYEYPNSNDVTISQYERFRSLITLQGNTYGAPAGFADFLAQLVRVTASVDDGINILARAEYDFVAGQSISNPEMYLTQSGFDYTFAFDYRAPSAAALPVGTPLNIVFTPQFRVPLANGGFDVVSYVFRQLVRTYADNTIRIVNLRFLDYAAFQLGSIVPIDTFCDDTDLYIVETELDAVPADATLQAFVTYGTPSQTETVFEEEANAGIYLPQATAPMISNVSPTFGIDKLAYFTLDISRFPSNAVRTGIAVVAVDF